MKPFSSPSDPGDPGLDPPSGDSAAGPRSTGGEVPDRLSTSVGLSTGLFDDLLAAGPVRAAVDDRAWLRALLDVEAALARAQARLGTVPQRAAETISRVCREHAFDPATIGAGATDAGNPVVPLVAALRATVGPDHARYVHAGATSQDVLDSAAMLVARRALGPLRDDVERAATAAARLAETHRDTLLPARTLLQQALPTSFGLIAAGWLSALDAATDRLTLVDGQALAVQLGGAAGTLAAFGDDGPRLVELFAADLGLAAPSLPWHTDRTRLADLAGALGTTAGSLGKIARDVTLHAQTEVGELAEERPGGSSTLPHKRNPIAAVTVIACASQAPGLVATLLASMTQEHQRAAGAWHAEWRPLRALLESVGSAAYWLRVCLDGLRVDAVRMRSNLDLTGGALLAERVSALLTQRLGRQQAHEIVARATRHSASGAELADRLAAELAGPSRVAAAPGRAAEPPSAPAPDRAELTELLDPAGYLGAADQLVDRALHEHAARRRDPDPEVTP
ncbi:3-carboxy-cis,cis-muconate cycloisomerase [Solwaraspora sp. WMMD406]|uniref:3-carboxy-cis,cis-muconate cycloisomerase n=1 Tax=Solwaraspora sp. WMMD406 TaxID=3016095 RepID=UPI002415FE59|nr:3-carboxy-cis,cis-muconate cycloisomerase [Solwaraspora sp. WMMD406]MDG4767150.1 3-carboxy-cis,cis-muconate cycloisomerase [Solwaraspora sp. WMMD406]